MYAYMPMSRDSYRNPVREGAQYVMEDASHVSINTNAVTELADDIVNSADMVLPAWDFGIYPSIDESDIDDVIDFIVVGNAVNYAFNNFETGEKYTQEVGEVTYTGADAMWASLYAVFSQSSTVLSPAYLQGVTRDDIRQVFCQNGSDIPMLESRVEQLNRVGSLMQSCNGSFSELLSDEVVLYGGDGIVDKLAGSAAFNDERLYGDQVIRFDKRAQLAVSMLYGKLMGSEYEFTISDIASFTVFADYGIPAGLRERGVLEYGDDLSHAIDTREHIPEGSEMEVEIRAATVVAGDAIQNALAESHGVEITVPVLDYVLWSMRSGTEAQQHLTVTTAY